MTTFYLGLSGEETRDATRAALTRTTLGGFVTYPELTRCQPLATRMPFWSLDSGAWSVQTKGIKVDRDRFIDDVRALRAQPNPPRDVYALDVIGDWRASVRNYEYFAARSLDVIPTFHLGDPEALLVELAQSYPKIGLGGVARAIRGPKRIAFFEQVFARVWPKKIHGFGVMGQDVLAVPFHSVDATSWMWPLKYRYWRSYGGSMLYGLSEQQIDLSPEIRRFETLAAKTSAKWRYELAKLDPPKAP